MRNIEITKKCSELKSVSGIDDDYLEKPPEVFYKFFYKLLNYKLFLKLF